MINKIARIKMGAALSATLLILPFVTHAQFYPHGFYIGMGAVGASMKPENGLKCESGTVCSYSGGQSVDLDSKFSPGGAAHLGYMFTHLPIQLEIAYQYLYRVKYDKNELNEAFQSPIYTITGTGDATITNQTLFANLILDGNFFNSPIVPFILGGVGGNYSETKASFNGQVVDTNETIAAKSDTSNNIERAWQVGAGIYYKMTPSLLLTFTYRYQDLGSTTWKVQDNKLSAGDLRNQQGEIGLTYVFGDQHHPPSLIDEK